VKVVSPHPQGLQGDPLVSVCRSWVPSHHLSSVHPYRVGVQSEPGCSRLRDGLKRIRSAVGLWALSEGSVAYAEGAQSDPKSERGKERSPGERLRSVAQRVKDARTPKLSE